MRDHRGLWAGGAAAAALLSGQAALAQDAQVSTLEEVVVTAQRRAQSLQDVPVTVTAFGAEQVEEARIREVQDVATLTPGLQFDAFPSSQPRIAIRGIGSSDRGAAGDPSAAVFLDDIYIGRPAAVAFDAFDVERIEVLKGPQGTLFGRNVVGGAINVVTRRPDLAGFDAAAEATVGNYERLEGAGMLNAPFADGNAAVRLSGAWRTHDGYVRNTFTGDRVEDQDTRSGRISLRAEPQPELRLLATLDGTRSRDTGPAQHVLDPDAGGPLAGCWTIDRERDQTGIGSATGRGGGRGEDGDESGAKMGTGQARWGAAPRARPRTGKGRAHRAKVRQADQRTCSRKSTARVPLEVNCTRAWMGMARAGSSPHRNMTVRRKMPPPMPRNPERVDPTRAAPTNTTRVNSSSSAIA